jgi:hypothetical protein
LASALNGAAARNLGGSLPKAHDGAYAPPSASRAQGDSASSRAPRPPAGAQSNSGSHSRGVGAGHVSVKQPSHRNILLDLQAGLSELSRARDEAARHQAATAQLKDIRSVQKLNGKFAASWLMVCVQYTKNNLPIPERLDALQLQPVPEPLVFEPQQELAAAATEDANDDGGAEDVDGAAEDEGKSAIVHCALAQNTFHLS